MHFFEVHVGDYEVATAHLSAAEDGILGRLTRRYYATEKPLEADFGKLQRLVRARTKEEKQAVVDVLNEFFSLRNDGWHDEKIDRAIEEFLAGAPEREVKKANEGNRTRRHREERARLFKVITDAGEHAPWNIAIAELRALANRVTGAGPETPPVTQPATAPVTPATATHYPLPTTHYPLSNSEPNGSGGKPPKLTDPGEIIFGYGLSMLVSAGTPEKQARSFLGGLRKQHGDEVLIDKLRQCAKAQVLQPLEWLAAALPPKAGRKSGKHAGFDSKDYHVGVTADGHLT